MDVLGYALLCCIYLFTARVVYALLLLLLLFLLFMFAELSTDVFVLFVCLFYFTQLITIYNLFSWVRLCISIQLLVTYRT